MTIHAVARSARFLACLFLVALAGACPNPKPEPIPAAQPTAESTSAAAPVEAAPAPSTGAPMVSEGSTSAQ